MSDFADFFAGKRAEVDARLAQLCAGKTLPSPLLDAVKYSLLGGGKRLRGVMLIQAVAMLGGKIDDAVLDFAAAIECIQAFSLVHDDLPCMDDDDMRRGKPSCHIAFGQAVALLAGDELLNMGHALMSACALGQSRQYLSASVAINDAISVMIGGQVMDIALANSDSLEQFVGTYHAKTAAFFGAVMRAGGYIAGADEALIEQLERFGHCFGMAFQLGDDIGETEQGIQLEDWTLARVHGLQVANDLCRQYRQQALQILVQLQYDTAFFEQLMRFALV